MIKEQQEKLAFEKYKKYIYKLAKKHYRKGMDFDDVVGQAMLGYVKAKNTYNSKKADFITHLYYKIRSEIDNYRYHQEKYVDLKENAKYLFSSYTLPVNFTYLDQFSDKAKYIVNLVLEADRRICKTRNKPSKHSIVCFLKGKKWTENEIKNSFVEISSKLLEV